MTRGALVPREPPDAAAEPEACVAVSTNLGSQGKPPFERSTIWTISARISEASPPPSTTPS